MCDMSGCGAELQVANLQQDIWRLQAEVRDLERSVQGLKDSRRNASASSSATEVTIARISGKVNEIATLLGMGGV